MVVRSLDVAKDSFRPLEEGEEILGPEVPYLVPLEHSFIWQTTRVPI